MQKHVRRQYEGKLELTLCMIDVLTNIPSKSIGHEKDAHGVI